MSRRSAADGLRDYEALRAAMGAIPISAPAPIVGLVAQLADVERRLATHIAARNSVLRRIVTEDDPTALRVALARLGDEIEAVSKQQRFLKGAVERLSSQSRVA